MPSAVACGAKRTTTEEPSLGALASSGPLELPCSLATTAAITAACIKIAAAAAVADQASVRGVSFDRNSDTRLPKSNWRRRRGERASSASICLIQVDRLDKLLADEIILPRSPATAN